MLPCKTPLSFNKDTILYAFEGVSFDDDTSSVEAQEWHVRSIQLKATTVNLGGTTLLNSARKATFVNIISKKKGTTWTKGNWAKYIPKEYQNKFELKDRLPKGLYTTKLQAIKFAVVNQIEYVASAKLKLHDATSKKEINIWTVNVADMERELVRLKVRLTKIINLKNKTKTP